MIKRCKVRKERHLTGEKSLGLYYVQVSSYNSGMDHCALSMFRLTVVKGSASGRKRARTNGQIHNLRRTGFLYPGEKGMVWRLQKLTACTCEYTRGGVKHTKEQFTAWFICAYKIDNGQVKTDASTQDKAQRTGRKQAYQLNWRFSIYKTPRKEN